MEEDASAVTSPSKEERTWAMVAHLSAFAGHVLPGVGQLVGPLVVWLIKRDSMPYVDNQGKEALNAQISFTIYGAIAWVLCFVLIGFLFLFVIYVADIVLVIMAAIAANEGKPYRYPLIFRLVK